MIGLVLASLSLGYWLGGRVADRDPDPRVLGRIVVLAGVLIAIVPFAAGPFLDVSVKGLDEVSAGRGDRVVLRRARCCSRRR